MSTNGVSTTGPQASDRTLFIRSLPDSMTLEQMVAAASRAGFAETTNAHIRQARQPVGLGYVKANGEPSLHSKTHPQKAVNTDRGGPLVGKSGPMPQPGTLFLRTLSESLTMEQMIEAAKKSGFTVTSDHVKKARRPVGLRYTLSDGSLSPSVDSQHVKPTPTPNRTGPAPTARSEFVQALPETLTLSQMVREAAKAGHKVTRKQADSMRRNNGLRFTKPDGTLSEIKKKTKYTVKKTTAAEALAAIPKRPLITPHDDLHSQMRRLAIRHGLHRLHEVLSEIEQE